MESSSKESESGTKRVRTTLSSYVLIRTVSDNIKLR